MNARRWPGRTAAGLIALMALPSVASAQAYRFQFGDGPARPGWVPVAADQGFDPAVGFGYETPEGARTVFSVTVPEGDYRVRVEPLAQHPITLWAESRRLMREPGARPVDVVVNVRRPDLAPPPPNAPGGTGVRLNDREIGSRSWDDRLTLIFEGPVASVEILPADVPRLFLLGDSTVADQAGGDYASWGQMLPAFLDESIAVANHAESGETLKSFLTGLRLDKALSQMRPGDLALIQFGHNDAKTQWPQTYAEAATTYRSYLEVYVAEIRRRGATPVLVTSPHRRTFGPDGRIVSSHGDYPDAVRAVAEEMGAPLIDLTALSARLYEALGPEGSIAAFGDGGRDPTHHNAYGAGLLARAVADRLRDLLPGGGVRAELARLDPDQPPPPPDAAAPAQDRQTEPPRGS